MKLNKMTAVLLAATMLGGVATPALAASKKSSDSELRAIVERQQKQIDALTAQIQAMQANAAPVVGALAGGVVADANAAEENAANIEFMQATIEAQQAQLDVLKKTTATNAPNWKGAPELKSGTGFTWKPNGVIQLDAGYVSNPDNRVPTSNLGWNSLFRRLLFGVEGTVPGGFKYKMQFNFAGGAVGFEDVLFAYEPEGSHLSAEIGYFYAYNGMENQTSNRFLTVMERAQYTEAFNEDRRIGVGAKYQNPTFLAQVGLFNGTSVNNNGDNTAWQLSARGVWYPKFGETQLHVGGSYQNRSNQKNALNGAYSTRPFTRLTTVRFVGAGVEPSPLPANPPGLSGSLNGSIASFGDQILGYELAAIHGPLSFKSEGQYLMVDAIQPGEVLSGGQATSGFRTLQDPNFFTIFGEVGYWFTGETLGYKNGKFDRTKIIKPFDQGGWGGIQAVARVDYLNMNYYVGGATGSNSGTVVNGTLNGGSQLGALFAVNWWPTDYVRFSAQYTHAKIQGGPLAAIVDPTVIGSPPVYDRNYGVNVFALRGQIDF